MAKRLTTWRKKGRSAATADYDGATIDYDSATQKYAGNGETHTSVIKKLTSWSNRAKSATRFIKNTASDANEQVYDTGRAYDVAATYDGIVSGEPRSTAKKPTAWSNA